MILYALEFPWIKEGMVSVKPMIKNLGILLDVGYLHKAVENKDVLLKEISAAPSDTGTLYFSAHGDPGIIECGLRVVTLEEIAEAMGDKYAGWNVHFGTCGTMRISQKRIAKFLEDTRAYMVSGYRKKVDWVEGLAMDEISMSVALWNRKKFSSYMSYYSSLIEKTGYVYAIR